MSEQQQGQGYAAAHEDYALAPVPENARRGLFSMSAVMLGFTFFAASMWTGGTLGQGFKLWPDLFIIILGGNLILGVYGALLGYAAAKTNLSTHILARYAFGRIGSKLPSTMLAITQIGWFGVGVAMFAYPVNKFLDVPNLPLIIGGGILMTYTVVIGFKAIEWLSVIAVPAILILGCMSVYTAISDTEGGVETLLSLAPTDTLTFAVGISLAVGSFISGATLTPDFVRYARTRKIGVWATIIGFTFGNSLMFIFGAVGSAATGMSDIAEVLAQQGLLGAGIALLVLNIWTTNDNALYASGLGL
ncbi:MAG: cytosine permease, partial [Marinobacterium sp.]